MRAWEAGLGILFYSPSPLCVKDNGMCSNTLSGSEGFLGCCVQMLFTVSPRCGSPQQMRNPVPKLHPTPGAAVPPGLSSVGCVGPSPPDTMAECRWKVIASHLQSPRMTPLLDLFPYPGLTVTPSFPSQAWIPRAPANKPPKSLKVYIYSGNWSLVRYMTAK